MKKFTLFTFVAVLATAFIGCSTANTGNGNVKVNGVTANSNTAVVVNANTMPVTNMNTNTMTGNSNRYNANMSRADYDKTKPNTTLTEPAAQSETAQTINGSGFKTRAALLGTNDLRESTVNVDVANDVVTLKGTVASKAEADKAISVAKGVEGVKDVKSVLKIQPSDSLTNQTVGTGSDTKTTTTTTTNTNTKR